MSMSFNKIKVEADLSQLESFLILAIPQISKNENLIMRSKSYYGLAARCRDTDSNSNEYELSEIEIVLKILLQESPFLSSAIVGQIHTFIGHIKAMEKLYDEAIESFMITLWLEASNINTPKINIALTTHRLALMYGQKGSKQQAANLLEKVILSYEKLHIRENHSIFRNAKEALRMFQLSDSPTTQEPKKSSRFAIGVIRSKNTKQKEAKTTTARSA